MRRAAAELRGLVESDEEFHNLTREAAFTLLPHQLRDLFVQILVHCEPANPLELWNAHRAELAGDFMQKVSTASRAEDAALHEIDVALQAFGLIATKLGLPEPIFGA